MIERVGPGEKVCCYCHVSKPLAEYHRSQIRPDGHGTACMRCACARARKFWLANKSRRGEFRSPRRKGLVFNRRALCHGVGMVRCILDRAPQCTADLHRKAQARCGGMVLLGHEAEHMLDVHGLRIVPEGAFVPVEDVPDYWVWSDEEAA